MYKITQESARAFRFRQYFRRSNTRVEDGRFYVHGNIIASWGTETGPLEPPQNVAELWITMSGWPTRLTRERLNGIFYELGLPMFVYQHNRSQFITSRWGYQHIFPGSWYNIPQWLDEISGHTNPMEIGQAARPLSEFTR